MGGRALAELRLGAFKSVRDAVLPIGDLTLLVGRNASGKSNVLDGLWVLAQLASGGEVRELLDGGRDGPAIRGGADGCAPLGSTAFALGCAVDHDGARVELDVRVQTEPVVQITWERLQVRGSRGREPKVLLETDDADPQSADVVARWNNGKQGRNPPVTFRATHLLTSQVLGRVPASTKAGQKVHEAAETVLSVLAETFVLDPNPHSMRHYVPERDDRLRRQADDLSAVIKRLLADPATAGRALAVVRDLSETDVVELDVVTSSLDDVMLCMHERIGSDVRTVPARLMSDGTLRTLAIVAALLEPPAEAQRSSLSPRDGLTGVPSTTLVIEEVENGLHPSQAAQMMGRIREGTTGRHVRTIATTHSPAMLDAVGGTDHGGVTVCARDAEGWTRLHRLTEMPNYFDVVTAGTLGDAATAGRLRPGDRPVVSSGLLEDVLGLL